MKQVICKSGFSGWQSRLREQYKSFDEWAGYAEMFALHIRLGYETAKKAWKANPLIQGSVNPSDYCRVNEIKKRTRSKSAKLNTVNVVEVLDGVINCIHAYSDNSDGNRKAEETFVSLIKQHNIPDFTKPQLEAMIEDGIYRNGYGYVLFLAHSN